MQKTVRIGSRESLLAVRQAEIIRDQILRLCPEMEVEIVTMKTTGDKILDKSLAKIGGKGLFVKELDRALMDGRIDIAVHSLKDVPMEENPDFPILACGRREDPRDVLLLKPGLHKLPEDGVVGTSSSRRMIQMKRLFPGCSFRGIRGNVQTRLRKLETEGYDGTLLAAAGLNRLDMAHVIGKYFSVDEIIPAAGQGILAVQGRKDARWEWLDQINDRDARAVAEAERQFIRVVGGDCTSPCAAHARIHGSELKLTGLYYSENSEDFATDTIISEISKARQAGEELAQKMMSRAEG